MLERLEQGILASILSNLLTPEVFCLRATCRTLHSVVPRLTKTIDLSGFRGLLHGAIPASVKDFSEVESLLLYIIPSDDDTTNNSLALCNISFLLGALRPRFLTLKHNAHMDDILRSLGAFLDCRLMQSLSLSTWDACLDFERLTSLFGRRWPVLRALRLTVNQAPDDSVMELVSTLARTGTLRLLETFEFYREYSGPDDEGDGITRVARAIGIALGGSGGSTASSKAAPAAAAAGSGSALKCLRLGQGELQASEPFIAALGAPHTPNLEELALADCLATQPFLLQLASRLHACNALTTLKLSLSALSGDCISVVALGAALAMGHARQLRHLELVSANSIARPTLRRFLCSLIHGPVAAKLKVLSLKTSLVGDDLAQAVADVVRFAPCLEELDLSHNRIGLTGAWRLAAAAANAPRLRHLQLRSNEICDGAAHVLANAWLGTLANRTFLHNKENGGAISESGLCCDFDQMGVHHPEDWPAASAAATQAAPSGKKAVYSGPTRLLDISNNEQLTLAGVTNLVALLGRGGEFSDAPVVKSESEPATAKDDGDNGGGGDEEGESDRKNWVAHRQLLVNVSTPLLVRVLAAAAAAQQPGAQRSDVGRLAVAWLPDEPLPMPQVFQREERVRYPNAHLDGISAVRSHGPGRVSITTYV